ncbi:DNA-binding protein [Acrocarpospora macrocephala]|uniref:DNA-binding protein n=1 Tax=Acrocarpospora macrocephala TaxID=150177 RepID=A0A5M3WH86_9ACTN|nr:DNA-binding protein [Acrocarpospora macrocephala]GES08497.1 DNA-binding protein [Acrocarpospora macrocephala]
MSERADGHGNEEVLRAGAILPPGTEGAGESAVPMTARRYHHPGLDGRVVVRLVAAELGAAEDLAAGFLGLEPDGEPSVVGFGLRRSLGFPEWVLARHPGDGHHALAVVPELERVARQAKSKPKNALDGYHQLAGRLAASVPHFLPTFYEQAGRVFIGVENATYAAQMFASARRSEAEHGLTVDEDRLDAVFLEFALAGALPVKVLSGHARELAARVPADEALRRFSRLCVRRTAGGLPPSAQMANDLRRLARAAGVDADAAEQAYLGELLGLPATLRAATGWWKAHRTAIAALAERDPEARATLLTVMPQTRDAELAGVWLDILQSSGATEELISGQAPADGVSGWLQRFLTARNAAWGLPPRLPVLYSLVERAADRLRAELAGSSTTLTDPYDVDLLDLLLALGLPVAGPGEHDSLRLEHWAQGEGQRDLTALAADGRFTPPFQRAADGFSGDADALRAVRLLAASTGGRPMLAEWVRKVATRSSAAGLPDLPDALRRLSWLPGEAVVLAEDEVRRAAAADLSPVLARTLRAGIFDELGWPAWEEAAATLVPRKDVDDIVVADAWPHLIVAGATQVRVLGHERTVLTHDLRIPPNDLWGDVGYHYVDGDLLVYWHSRAADDGFRGYWHTSADRIHSIEAQNHSTRGSRMDWYRGDDPVTLALPGGGRATGLGVLHPGDTTLPSEQSVITDGVSYWVWTWDGSDYNSAGWHEYDPVGGHHGRKSTPAFFTDVPAGTTFHRGWLLPAPAEEPTPAGVPVGGLLGWRVTRLPDGSLRGEDLSGRTVTLPPDSGSPVRALAFPGTDQLVAVVKGSYQVKLVDADGVLTATAKTDAAPGPFAQGTLILPPLRHWHCLRPRDPEGSAALRELSLDRAARLLAAAGAEDLPARIRELLPQVSHDGLVAGIAGIVRFAAVQQAALNAVAARLGEALAGGHHRQAPAGPTDYELQQALSGLGVASTSWRHGVDGAFQQIRLAQAPAESPGVAGGIHLDRPELPHSTLRWDALLDHLGAVAYRTGSAATTPEHRVAQEALLDALVEAGLPVTADPSRWRRITVHLSKGHLTGPDGDWRDGNWLGVLPLDGGAYLVFVAFESPGDAGARWTALFHDPTGRFEVPPPYTLLSSAPVGEDRPQGWLESFRAELAAHGPAPWRPAAAEEFARLTGVSLTLARLVVAGLPSVDAYDHSFLAKETRTMIGLKLADAAIARDELRGVDAEVRRAIVAALLPPEPARLWSDGPDVAAAAAIWNDRIGPQALIPEWLLGEASRAVKTGWNTGRALRALIDPAGEPELSRDLLWAVQGDRATPADDNAIGFSSGTLCMAVTMAGWLAHRLPAGDPIRAALPGALAAVRARLANPDLMLDLNRYVDLVAFRKAAGTPTQTGNGYERYGAVIMATHDDRPSPAIRTSLLDAAGDDPYLRALLGSEAPFPVELTLRTARDPRFEALLASPVAGEGAGEGCADGIWWPQDPARSVPSLVVEVAKEHGLGEDAATAYLMLLAMPDPTDRNVARWTGWKPARLKSAHAELAATDLVVQATRERAGRSLFLPGGWAVLAAPRLPVEQWKLPLFEAAGPQGAPLVPLEPVADLYARAWRRVRDGDVPRFEELKVKRGPRR